MEQPYMPQNVTMTVPRYTNTDPTNESRTYVTLGIFSIYSFFSFFFYIAWSFLSYFNTPVTITCKINFFFKLIFARLKKKKPLCSCQMRMNNYHYSLLSINFYIICCLSFLFLLINLWEDVFIFIWFNFILIKVAEKKKNLSSPVKYNCTPR